LSRDERRPAPVGATTPGGVGREGRRYRPAFSVRPVRNGAKQENGLHGRAGRMSEMTDGGRSVPWLRRNRELDSVTLLGRSQLSSPPSGDRRRMRPIRSCSGGGSINSLPSPW
jgi:hypothetical protein